MTIDHEKGVARYLAGLIGRIGSTTFSEADRSIVRRHLLDAIGAAFIGFRGETLADLARLCVRVKKGSAWPGSGPDRVNPIDAGMIWAFAVNASVFEDGSREGACHPAAAVIPVLIGLSEGKGWELIDKAAIAGYDVMVRLARGGNPGFTRKGFHPTAICAPFGAAATASVLLGHDLFKAQNAFCLAALGSSGLMSSFKCGPTQPLQVAWAVRSGMVAAMMAGAGHSGYSQVFEEGFYPAYLGHDPDPPADQPLEHEYAVKGSYLKPYPGCRHIHPSIDAFGQILKENRVDPAQIEKIVVGTYKITVETEIHTLKNRGDAYFNIPYALAARAVLGNNDWDAFDERHFKNDELMEIMKKIKVHIDPEIESLYPGQRGAFVTVHMVDGSTLYRKVDHPLGEPENPLPAAAIRKKFRNLAGPFLSEKGMDGIERILDVSRSDEPTKGLFETVSEKAGN